MSLQTNHLYEFGPFRLDAAERLLLREGEAVQLTPKAFDLLLMLVQNHGHLLEKDELLKRVWPDSFVEEANLSYNVSLDPQGAGRGRERAAVHRDRAEARLSLCGRDTGVGRGVGGDHRSSGA